MIEPLLIGGALIALMFGAVWLFWRQQERVANCQHDFESGDKWDRTQRCRKCGANRL